MDERNATLVRYWETYYSNLSDEVDFHFNVILCPFGVIANLLAFLVFTRKRLNTTNMGFFYRMLTFTNITNLLFVLFFMEAKGLFGFDFYTHSNLSCEFIMYGRRLVRELNPMLEALLTTSRFLDVTFPYRFGFMRKNNANILLIVCTVMACYLLLNMTNLYYFVDREKQVCTASEGVVLASDIILIVLRSFLPLAIMFVLNSFLIRKLLSSTRTKQCQTPKRDQRFSFTVILMNATFTVFNLPVTLVYIVKHSYLTFADHVGSEPSVVFLARLDFAWSMSFNVTSLYYVLFAFLHLYFNKMFRSEVARLVCRRKKVFITAYEPKRKGLQSYKISKF
jgi:hypothetical protein